MISSLAKPYMRRGFCTFSDIIVISFIHLIFHQLTVHCQKMMGRAPREMWRGSTATDGQYIYFNPLNSTSLYRYEFSTEKMIELPLCKCHDSGIVIINGELTTVGGRDGISRTNKLFTLLQGKWVEKYPPMSTARSHPAVVNTTDGDYVIIIGGYNVDCDRTATVEIFQVKSRRWHKLTDLPQPLSTPSATICGDQLNVIGNDGNGYSCSLQDLPSNEKTITSPLTLFWAPLPSLPVTWPTAATLSGQLVIIGGRQGWSLVNSILQLVDSEWVRIGSMASVRSYCLVASPSLDRIIIVGGNGTDQSVEECTVV